MAVLEVHVDTVCNVLTLLQLLIAIPLILQSL